jgi:eukaryotic-like serine/threonine-protein kinase
VTEGGSHATLATGTRLGAYEITGFLGAGGMGQVWRARDSKLGREVAIKTLAPGLAGDADRLARLEREARLLAALNHPNIATIYGIEEHDGARFLVLELVEGLTLADRLLIRPLPIEQALRVALQISMALEAAHEKGVIHRDLKPANVKLTPDDQVKVLDFGLAKSVAASDGNSRTATVMHSEVGVVTGTAPYMSPEQARGDPTGRQTDIWSLGVVLYEMLTQVSPFKRDTATETLARVLEAQPDFTQMPVSTPAAVQRLVRRCLEKDVKRRFRDVGDVRIELEDALAQLASGPTPTPAAGQGARRHALRNGGLGLALLAVAAVAGAAVWLLAAPRGADSRAAVVRLSIAGLPQRSFAPIGAEHIALSPDGTRFAYAGNKGLVIRELARTETVPTEPAGTGFGPFFSPDGAWLAYMNLDASIAKIPSAGGAPVTLVRTTERFGGGTWCASGAVVYATTGGLHRVSSEGGESQTLLEPDRARQEREFAWPHCLPDGHTVLFTVLSAASAEPRIASLDLDTLERRELLDRGASPRYVATGHLLYIAGQQLTAVKFDARTRTLQGPPVTLNDVSIAVSPDNSAAEYAVAANGTLAFIPPGVVPRLLYTLEWVDRAGNVEPLGLEPGSYVYPRVSPDGKRVVIDVGGGRNRDAWIWDLRVRSLTRLTDGPTEDLLPLWSPDGSRVFFSSNRGGNFDIYSQAADGATPARLEFGGPKSQIASSFSPDGKKLLVTEEFKSISVVDLTGPSIQPLLQRDTTDFLGEISPDGHWLAYESNESGEQFEIYVRPFPDVGGQREKVSIDGGRSVRWGLPGSNELYYVDFAGSLMAVPIKTSPALEVGRAARLFDFMPPGRGGQSGRTYDLSPVDGRFLRSRAVADSSADNVSVSVVLNWFTVLSGQFQSR